MLIILKGIRRIYLNIKELKKSESLERKSKFKKKY
jgi:hypothetical protein